MMWGVIFFTMVLLLVIGNAIGLGDPVQCWIGLPLCVLSFAGCSLLVFGILRQSLLALGWL